MTLRSQPAQSTYWKRLDDGRYEVGYIEQSGALRKCSTVADQGAAFWWVWTR